MWNLLRRTRKNQKSGRDVREAGWTSLFQAVAEPFSGAWQQGVKADPEAVLSFHAVFACISLISQDIAKMRLRLMQTDAHGIRRETRRGDIARLCRRPNAQQNRIQFFELWLNAKLRHGNTVVLKIRNARGQIKELRILDWSRVEPLVADDGEVFYRITPDRNCGITEAVTVPAREVIHDRFNCFFHPLIGLPPVYAAGLAATQGHHIQENSTSFFSGDALYLQQQNYSLEALSRRDAREDPFASAGKTVSSQLPDGASDGNKAISETEHDAVKAMFRGDTEKMTERELSIIRALGEEFSTVLADLQRTFEGKMASQAQAFEEKLTSLSAVLQKHVTVDEVRPVLQAMVDDAVGAIPVPRDGRDYDPDVLQQAVNDAVANIPQPADGKSLTPDDVRPMLEQMVKEAVSHIHVPRDGRDYDPDVLQKAVLDAVSALPAPQDGRDATALEILPAIDDQKSFPRGTYATHQGGLWRAYEKTHGMRGWECLVDGVADIDVSMTGERLFSVVVRQSSGQRTEKTFSLPVMLYRGVFRAGETYHPGDTVTWGGSLWHCNSMTEDKPGEAHSSAWTLAAKRGRDAGGGK